MIYYPLSALFNTIVFIILCLIVILNNPKSKLNRSFCYFGVSIIFWSFGYFLWQLSDNYNDALFWCRILTIGSCFISPTFLHFSLILIEKFNQYYKTLIITYILSTILSLLSFTPLLVADVQPRLFFPFWPSPGNAYFLLIILFVITISYSLFLTYKRYKEVTGAKRNQLKYVFLGIFIGFLGGATNFPLWYDIPLPPYGNILAGFIGIFIAYAIVKHQLMDIRIVIKKSIIYSISIATISILYLLSIFILEKLAQKLFGYSSLAISIGTAFLLGLFFIPLRYKIQYFMDCYFFKGSTEEILNQNEQLRREITQSEKYKTLATLATGIAHEVKNPLTAIKTFSEYLPQRLDDKEFLKKFASIVGREVDRIDDLTHQLLDYGKPTPLARKKTDINKLIEDSVDILNSKFIDQKINVNKRFIPNKHLLNIDPNQIKQALLNILLNSIEAMPQGGELTISTSVTSTSYFVIKIEDTGDGIPKEDLSQIFDPFFSKRDNGTGLGLSITQGLIENHRGIIQIKSKVGSGTSVRIDLPC